MSGVSAVDKWDEVLSQLWRRSRFASYFFQSVALVDNENVPTLALAVVNHRFILFYNRAFVLTTPTDHLIGLLIHEMLHVVLSHEHRVRPGQQVHLCNLAQDMVINSYLKANQRTFFSRKDRGAQTNLVLPPGLPEIPAVFGTRTGRAVIYDVTWEEVYWWLNARYGEENKKRRNDGRVEEQPPGIDQWQKAGPDRENLLPSEGLQFVDNRGNPLPTGIHLFGTADAGDRARAGAERILGFVQKHGECREERLYSDLNHLIKKPESVGNLKWKKAIRSIADQTVQTSRWDYSFARPNRRFFDAGIYAPGRYLKRRPLVTIVVDVSGSMAADPGQIEAAFGAVEDLTRDFQVNLLCIDQDLFVPRKTDRLVPLQGDRGNCLYQPGDWRHIKTGSRGATFFAPLFNAYLKNHGEALIVITDGEIYDLNALKPYDPTFWIVVGNKARLFTPPFGRVMAL